MHKDPGGHFWKQGSARKVKYETISKHTDSEYLGMEVAFIDV